MPRSNNEASENDIIVWNQWLDANRARLGIAAEFSFYEVPERYVGFGDKHAQQYSFWRYDHPKGPWCLIRKVIEFWDLWYARGRNPEWLDDAVKNAYNNIKSKRWAAGYEDVPPVNSDRI